MQTFELVATYSPVGDMISLITFLSIFILISRSLFFDHDKAFRLIKFAMGLLMVGSTANIAFYFICISENPSFILLFILRDIYHITVLFSLYLTITYLKQLLQITGPFIEKMTTVTIIIYVAGIVLDLISPFTHFGFYYENGLWSDSTYIKPYSFVYVYSMVILAFMLIVYKKRLIKPVSTSLIATISISAVIQIVENMFDSNSFTTYTYVLPIIVVIILLHSKPYNLITGAMSPNAFSSYTSHVYARNKQLDFMILKLEMQANRELPQELGKVLHSFWNGYFNKAVLFEVRKDTFALAIESDINYVKEHDERIKELIEEKFPPYYERYHIPYKVFAIPNIDFIDNAIELQDVIDFMCRFQDSNTLIIHDTAMTDKLRYNRQVMDVLRDIAEKRDLDDDRILVYCQPVKNVSTGEFDTAEALMRMKVDNLGMVFPDIFIPLAEGINCIHPMSMIILNKTCKYIRKAMDEGHQFKRISVNFSIPEFMQEGFCDEIIEIIEKNNVPFEKIGIELTESQSEADYKRIKAGIERLKALGLHIYLDDFGTGYSNFDRILKLGMDVIKFDRSLLNMAEKDEKALYSMKLFSKGFLEMGYEILFEGVETEEHISICTSCQANYLQGYKYSKPIPIEELNTFLK